MDVMRAELMAVVDGLKLALKMGVQAVILKGDSRLGIEQIETSTLDLSYNESLVHEISVLRLRFARFKVQYVSRNCTKIADSLTHLAKFVGSKVWVGEVLNCVRDIANLNL